MFSRHFSARKNLLNALLLSFSCVSTGAYAATETNACAALKNLQIDEARVISSSIVQAGAFHVSLSPTALDLPQRLATMPAFCRVQIESKPSLDSHVGIEIWLPLAHWNGRFLGTGNGGGAGKISYEMGLIEGLKRGFAVANTDMGTAPNITEVQTHPERWRDFGYRATHEMTRISKTIVQAFYRSVSFRSYFAGCSTGGQQALAEAQRYPQDYDGILAGDPGNNRTHVSSYFLWNYSILNSSVGAKLSPSQWALVSKAVIGKCAGKDGGAPGDRFLTDPRECRFDTTVLPLCTAEVSDRCLTHAQIDSVEKLYSGPVNPRTGERIYAGLTLGSENMPLGPVMQGDPSIWPAQQFYMFDWALGTKFVPRSFSFDRDLDRVDAQLASVLNANTDDLSDFARRGGKLILYSGLADPAVPFSEVINYYDRLNKSASSLTRAGDFAQLFLVPGMGHCFGGPGATSMGQPFASDVPADTSRDILMSLIAWQERGVRPTRIVAHKGGSTGEPAVERPVCAYPAFPTYQGGNPKRIASFQCVNHVIGVEQKPDDRYLN